MLRCWKRIIQILNEKRNDTSDMNFYVGNILTIVKNMDHFHIIKKNQSINLKIIKSIEVQV